MMQFREPDQRQLALVFDIGGTRLKGGLITRSGEILATKNLETPDQTAEGSSPEQVVKSVLAMANWLSDTAGVQMADVDGVGISIAGFITAEGLVTATAHLSRKWIGYHLGQRLEQNWAKPIYFALDTPAPTLGEAYFGAGIGFTDFVYITVSTGIGAGIIAGGRYFTGGLGWAGGVGHTIIDESSPRLCEGCGNFGCLETFAAKQGILTTANELLDANPESYLNELIVGKRDQLTPKLIYEAALAEDPVAKEVFDRAGHALGIGITNLVDIVAPQRVVIGGGIALAGDLLLDPAREIVRAHAFPPNLRTSEIVQSALGDLSGIFGAAAMVFYDLRVNPG
jgi:glucokinase